MRVAAALGMVLVLTAPVSAHMVVLPDASRGGEVERYTLVVPTEGRAATVTVELHIPLGMEIIAFDAKPGWSGANEAFPIGAATLRWSKGRIPPGQMTSFEFLALNPPGAHTLRWNAMQWYEDGSTDQWGEGAPDDHPASTTTLVAAASADAAPAAPPAHEHGAAHDHDALQEHEATPVSEPATPHDPRAASRAALPADEPPDWALWIALAALAASLAALGVAIDTRRRTPY